MHIPIKSILLSLAGCIGILFVSAQQKDSIRLAVQYNMSYAIDTTQIEASIKQNVGILFIGDKTSQFTTVADIQSEVRRKLMREKYTDQPNMFKATILNWAAPYQFIRNFDRKNLSSYTVLGSTNYEVEESTPLINWSIATDTKNIQGYKCQKATAFFRGRNYEVWFTPDLPFNNGPWKLGGLPGLILEASDSKKEIVFTLKEISKSFQFNPYQTNSSIKVPDQTLYTIEILGADFPIKKISKTDLSKTVAVYRQDPAAFIKAILNTTEPMRMMGPANGSNGRPVLFNNPIEKEGY